MFFIVSQIHSHFFAGNCTFTVIGDSIVKNQSRWIVTRFFFTKVKLSTIFRYRWLVVCTFYHVLLVAARATNRTGGKVKS